MIISSPFYELLFNVAFTEKVCDNLFASNKKLGIELLAEIVHSYVIENTPQKIMLNLRMSLIDAIICTATTAIFYKENGKIGKNYEVSKLFDMSSFHKIFTLNYREFWDKAGKCFYLHGQYNNEMIVENDKPVLLYSLERYKGFENYDALVMQLESAYNLSALYTRRHRWEKTLIKETIHAKGVKIGVYTTDFENEFISLTDIAKFRNEDDPRFVIQNWMRNRNTIEFFAVWEELHNSDFNRV